MSDTLVTICLLGAAICFTLAALNFSVRVNLIGLGLLAWVLTQLVPRLS